MRNSFVNAICELASINENIFLITGDLGYGVLDKFRNVYPNRFINAGIAEQTMTSVAVGMALEGKKVFTYSIGNFNTLRCVEQIRNDAAYHNANVKIVSIGAGFAYGSAGMSHHATEDLAIMRALPNVTIFSPGDPLEAVEVTKAAASIEGTCYIRLGKGGETLVHKQKINFKVGKAIEIIRGNDVCIFATGAILYEAHEAVVELEKMKISASLYSFPTIKPIDEETILECALNYKYIITVEEHNIIGGFGSAVSEVLCGIEGRCATLKRVGLNDVYSSVVGSQEYLRKYYGISKDTIIKYCKKNL